MKKNFLLFGLIAALTFGNTLTAYANDGATVSFNADKTLTYSGVAYEDGAPKLGNAFEGIAPGESATQTITMKNDNKRSVDFYMNASALKALEDSSAAARGAGYDIQLSVGDKVLYDSVAGGYASEGASGDDKGIKAMNKGALEGYVLVATLAKGETENVNLTITLDGEAMDNNSQVSNYSYALGQVGFEFQVAYEDPEQPAIVTKTITKKGETKVVRNYVEIIEGKVPLSAVATGDNALIGVGIGVLVLGIFLILFAGRKKKAEEEA